MIAVRFLTPVQLKRRLAPYKCKLLSRDPVGFELWETGWGEPFTLSSEPDGRYDEWQYQQVITGVVAKTMPLDWFSDNSNDAH